MIINNNNNNNYNDDDNNDNRTLQAISTGTRGRARFT